nr:replication protein A 70 kDa DNA-binding subunit B [Tanacetum cinerariifolium]
MEMIVMDEHATVRMDKLKQFQHHLKEGNALTIQRYSLDEIIPKFRMVYNAMRLSFLSNTKVDSCTDFNGSVHDFVWRPFKSITDLEKEEDGQFDVGQVIACEDLDNYNKNGKAGKKPVTLIDEEGNEIKCTLRGDYAQQFNDFLNSCDDHDKIVLVLQFAMMKFWDGDFYELNLAIGVQSVIVDTIIAIQDEGWWYLGCRACHGKVIKSTDYIDLESDMPKKPNGPNDWWFRLQISVQDETGTMSLSLFNDESESDGSIPTEITNLIGNKYAFKLAIDDYNVKKLLHVFTVLRFSNDQEIINSVLACATPIKDLESQTDENTTPNEKQKTNKRPAEGEPGILPEVRKRSEDDRIVSANSRKGVFVWAAEDSSIGVFVWAAEDSSIGVFVWAAESGSSRKGMFGWAAEDSSIGMFVWAAESSSSRKGMFGWAAEDSSIGMFV